MRWGKMALIAVTAIVGASGAGMAASWLWLRSGVPEHEGVLRVDGLSAPVEIGWDAHAIPHIRAASDADAYFALGYVHARDRLWQMETHRRVGAGRLAEVVGDAALPMDRLMRTLGFYRLAEESYAAVAPEVRAALDSYAAGVNAWLANREGPLPIEFQLLRHRPEPWRPADSLVWQKLMALQLGTNHRTEILRAELLRRLTPEQVADLFPAHPDAAPATLAAELSGLDAGRALAGLAPPLGPDSASNEWVLDGSRTATGKPILANDPHLGLQAPILWYLARIETPTLEVTGATVPGVPFHVLGHNRDVAWGFTTTGTDVQDLFVERIDPADAGRYLAPGGSLPFEVREEVIRVADAEPETLTVRTTRHGPVLPEIDGAAVLGEEEVVLALAFTALENGDTTAEGLYRLNRADGWDSFVDALRRFRAPQQNVVYADREGNIGFYVPGAVPVRRSGDGRLPVPGWTGAFDWTGLVPFDELPHAFNPPSGRFVNANNRVVGPDYPYLLTKDWDDPFRAARIVEVLDGAEPQTVESTEALLMDDLSLPALRLMPLLGATETDHAGAREALARLADWDGRMDRARPEPLVFASWLRTLGRRLVADELGPLADRYGEPGPRVVEHILTAAPGWCDDVTTEEAEDCASVLRASLEEAVSDLAARYGGDQEDWTWGRAHVAPLSHPVLARVPVLGDLFDVGTATSGGDHTVNRGASSPRPGLPFAHVHGAGYRAVYDLSDLGNSRFVIATGQSGNPLSPHYGDLVEKWRDGVHLTLARSRAELAERGLGRLVLQPEP